VPLSYIFGLTEKTAKMTSEQKKNLALAAEAIIIIYLLMQKKKECDSKKGGGGGGTTAPVTQLPPMSIFTPSVTTTAPAPAPATVVPETETTTKVRAPRYSSVKPIRTNQPPPPPPTPNQPEITGLPCTNMEGWITCPNSTKCYPPLDQADNTIDYCGDGSTPTLKSNRRFVNYVKEANFFRQKKSRFR